MVRCRCDCGTEKVLRLENLRSGNTSSCGCMKGEMMREIARQRFSRQGGMAVAHPALYKIWGHMIPRCEDPADRAYKDYGGRGIKVCAGWHDFRVFAVDVLHEIGDRPSRGYSFDRKDNDGDYEPGNVRWATRSEQNANTRNRRTGRMGVSRLPSGRYQARISVGVFATADEAEAAYRRARTVLTKDGVL
jgi:hypothetical protein